MGTRVKKNIKIKLEGALTIKNIHKFKNQLDTALEQKKNVVFEASLVERIDTATFQLITAFNEKLKSDGLTLAWEKPSSVVSEIAEILDLEHAVSM